MLQLQDAAGRVTVDDSLVDYMLAIVERPAPTNRCRWASARADPQALYRAAQALALMEGREYVIPDDIKRLVAIPFSRIAS